MRQILLVLLLGIFSSTLAQEITISGVISDGEIGETLPGVTVLVKGTTQGTVTNYDGIFTLSVDSGDVLQISYIGYITQEITIGNKSSFNISLQPDIVQMDEVVVIGYGTQRRSDITGSTGVLTTKDVELQPVQRVENMLQGKVAGVTVSQNSGAPGATPSVNIRGFHGNPTYVIDGMIGADINAINPNDIKGISILKDASATAIYGSRGANGVILITTKQGTKKAKLKIEGEYFHSISELHTKLDLLDPITYMQTVNQKATEAGALERFTREDILLASTDPNFGTDWQDYIFRAAHTDNLNINLSKGWDNISARLSLGGRNENGIIDNSDYQRFTSRLNVSANLSRTTKINVNAGYAQEQTHNVGDRSNGASRIVQAATSWAPNLPVINPNTNDYSIFQGYGPTVLENPSYLINDVDGGATRHIGNFTGSISQKLSQDLTIKASGAIQYTTSKASTFRRFEPGESGSVTEINSNERTDLKNQFNLQLDYKKNVGVHHFEATMVGEVIDQKWERLFFMNNYDTLGNPGETLPRDPIPLQFQTLGQVSFLTRVHYDYKEKILITGSLRLDASSRLPADDQWDQFFSGAIAYRLDQEPFFSDISWLEGLKIRVGYGEVGNLNSLGFAEIQNLVNPGLTGYAFGGNTISSAVKFEDGNGRANPSLTWAGSRTTNFGLDLVVFDGKIEFIADVYAKYIENALFREPVPQFLGGGSFQNNVGRYRDSGIELTLIHQWESKGDWSIRNSINFTLNRSKVLNIPEDTLFRGSTERGFDQQSHILIKGQQIGQLLGYQYLGTKVEGAEQMAGEPGGLRAGDAIYLDLNGDNLITIEDMVTLGTGHPSFTWGFNSHISYKNFTMNVFIQGVHGTDAFNLPQHALLGGGGGVLNATSTDILNSASYGGNLPTLNANFRSQSSLFVEDASFIRARNITIGYDFDKKLIDKLNIGGLRVYAGVQNLFTITNYSGYDPETKSGGLFNPGVDRGSFPVPRTYTFGLNFSY